MIDFLRGDNGAKAWSLGNNTAPEDRAFYKIVEWKTLISVEWYETLYSRYYELVRKHAGI